MHGTLLAQQQSGLTLARNTKARLSVLTDDNRLPTSTRAKLRLVHGASKAGALTLSVDYAVVVGDLAAGSGSAFVTPLAATEMRLDVTAAESAAALYADSDVALQAQGVHALRLLGGNDAPTGVLRKDR
jgi:enterochelin esterase-like enzyme